MGAVVPMSGMRRGSAGLGLERLLHRAAFSARAEAARQVSQAQGLPAHPSQADAHIALNFEFGRSPATRRRVAAVQFGTWKVTRDPPRRVDASRVTFQIPN